MISEINKKIFWIASYPKSGNTWIRAIITSLFFTKDGKFNFNLLKNIDNFEKLQSFKFVKLLNQYDYNRLKDLKIISKYWIEAQKRISVSEDFAFYKTHSANMSLYNNEFTNTNNSLGLIYIVRDPRDIVISYSKHLAKDIDDTIKILTTRGALTFSHKESYPIVLSRWDEHYISWQYLNVPKLIIKYEELLLETKYVVNKIINFFIKNYDISFSNIEVKIDNIVESTSFNILREYEKKYGFKEAKKSDFFRKGQSMQWKNELTKYQIEKIENPFKSTMKKLHYL